MATAKSLENEIFLPVINFSNCGTFVSESSCSDRNACTSHRMLSLAMEKEREIKLRELLFEDR